MGSGAAAYQRKNMIDYRLAAMLLLVTVPGIAAGAYLVPLLLVLMGWLDAQDPLWVWGAPIVSGLFLGLTGAILLWDLETDRIFHGLC